MTEIFRFKAISVGSPTAGNSFPSSVAGWMEFLKRLKFKIKRAAGRLVLPDLRCKQG